MVCLEAVPVSYSHTQVYSTEEAFDGNFTNWGQWLNAMLYAMLSFLLAYNAYYALGVERINIRTMV